MERDAIAVSGSSGLIGAALIRSMEGARVLRLVRSGASGPDDVPWGPQGGFDAARLEECEAVVHLAGEPIAAGRWSTRVKERIRASRVEGTRALVEALRRLGRPPSTLVVSSAIGYYGDRGDEELTETSPSGTGFLPEVCRSWEREALRAGEAGLRVVTLRTGIVLAREGGALARMLPPFRLGLGGRIGSGRQWMSWIHIDDMVSVIRAAISDRRASGPVNAVAPAPARNADFARALGAALRRPAIAPLPAFAARLMLGEMADALLLSSQRVVPRRLADLGHTFRHPRLDDALRDLVRR